MKIKRNYNQIPPTIKTAIGLGIYREVPRHELPADSWQREVYDRHGRRFYESTSSDQEPAGRQLTVDEAAAEAAQRGNTIMVKSPWGGEVMPYDQFVRQRSLRQEKERALGSAAVSSGSDRGIFSTSVNEMAERAISPRAEEAISAIQRRHQSVGELNQIEPLWYL